MIRVQAGEKKEKARPSGSARKETPKAENDGSLVLPHYLHAEPDRNGEGHYDEQERQDSQKPLADAETW